jgi:hypothetical protein
VTLCSVVREYVSDVHVARGIAALGVQECRNSKFLFCGDYSVHNAAVVSIRVPAALPLVNIHVIVIQMD